MLLWALECDPERDAEWNEWYNLEHVPALLQVPGFHSSNRYEKVTETTLRHLSSRFQIPRYLSYYELYDESVLQSEAYHINRSSLGPGMRPEWTKRMLTYVLSVMGGTYQPLTETWMNVSDRTVQNLWVLFLEPYENNEDEIDEWYLNQLLPLLQKSNFVKACRLIGSQQSTLIVKGGVKQENGVSRIVLISVDKDFSPDDESSFHEVWKDRKNSFKSGNGALYQRIPLSKMMGQTET
ncbi:DUF4286 family protein [Alkalihalobacillus sp. BA299]|uniref:DUF4286 family protein n=1 Tax=Alkalihalobacillus sp. BA299 TaxID=2815938 RepID=UPI001ADBCA20|nr:DUF4286 family protein [Alkalihalobacillus sp. BA299]